MSDDLDAVARILRRHRDLVDTAGRKSEALINRAESYLGVRFPASYREFLRRWGVLSIGSDEFYGVIHDKFENSGVPDSIWYTARKREQGLPKNLVVVFNADGVEYYCLDTASIGSDGECPVVIWDTAEMKVTGKKAESFSRFLINRAQAIDETEES